MVTTEHIEAFWSFFRDGVLGYEKQMRGDLRHGECAWAKNSAWKASGDLGSMRTHFSHVPPSHKDYERMKDALDSAEAIVERMHKRFGAACVRRL